ncbi:hypothetical protein F5Y16DRAFT_6247 [Xylariaceae sp. FL0255]|nr:hypothetical protein F5Y16DRAFT_6247 [Xylariaceae sp. FL0255]
MAATAVMAQPTAAQIIKPLFTPLIQESPLTRCTLKDDFNPKKHLAFKKYPKTISMKELGFPEGKGISPVAVSQPFPLFTEEAIMRMRAECLSPEVIENYSFSSNLSHCMLRGFTKKYAPFVNDVWKNPETLEIISKIAGIDLVPALDVDVAHINVSVKSEQEKATDLESRAEMATKAPILGWHKDSYPFVCVTMLSDCTGMIGGETALRTGNGDVMKVRGPQMGCAVVMQGRYIEHSALAALGSTERITMVTSLRPRNPLVRDETVLETVRPISVISDLYNQFAEYRFEILEARLRMQLKDIRDMMATGRGIPTAKLKAFIQEQEQFLAHMDKEIVEDDKVVRDMILQDGIVQDDVDESRVIISGSSKGRKRQRRT